MKDNDLWLLTRRLKSLQHERCSPKRVSTWNIDEDISSTVTPAVTPTSVIPLGPITRAPVRQINGQVLSLLRTYDLTDKNTMLHSCSDLLVLRNKGEIRDEANCSLKSDGATLHACPMNPFHPSTMSHACMYPGNHPSQPSIDVTCTKTKAPGPKHLD